ncbi:Tudor and KH domain-containing protein, partial [Durusdinium trenchii]
MFDIPSLRGGWCPPGYVDEKGPIGPLAETWHLKALPADVWEEHRGFFESLKLSFNNTDIWAQRTLMNVLDSSGTLTILPEATTDHTNLGIDATMAMKKPLLVLRSFDPHEGTFTKWLQDNNVQVLNINGPRESSIPGINAESKVLFERLFRRAERQERERQKCMEEEERERRELEEQLEREERERQNARREAAEKAAQEMKRAWDQPPAEASPSPVRVPRVVAPVPPVPVVVTPPAPVMTPLMQAQAAGANIAAALMASHPAPGGEESDVTIHVQVPAQRVKDLLGVQGRNIKAIKSQTGVLKVGVLDRNDPANVEIVGTAKAVEHCRSL